MSNSKDNKLYITFSGDIQSIFKPLRNTGYVEVGILGTDKKTADDEVSVAYYGSVHEFGYPPLNIPERSFLRKPIQKKLPKVLEENFSKIMEKIYTGQAEKVLKDIGMEARNIVIDAFKTHGVDGEWKPLKEETINRKSVTRQTKKGVKIIKKGDAPLIDTGALRQSIAYKVILKKGI